jgi:CubicO group peptidase (beta-lactamase class C family)
MRRVLLHLILISLALNVSAQLYFPPNNSNVWDTIPPSELGWCQTKIDSLYDFLETNSTKAFILLKDGKIVLEQYFNGHSSTSNWYWASAGKTLTAFMVGIAQQENFLKITDTTSTHLGPGWTDCTAKQEEKITIWHQLTMTSGLDDGVPDPYCTDDTCLQYRAEAGTRWAYHNAPYTLLDQVIQNATSQTLNSYTNQKLKNPTGMDGLYLQQGYNNLYVSNARSMARFGLLMLNNGNWNGNQILSDTNYFNQMVNTSQNLNESYGFLWWLNGKNSFMVPQTQFVFKGSFSPNAPGDMIAALGKNGQFINVVPSQNLVWIRMGDSPENSLVPFTFNDDIWEHINNLSCNTQILNVLNDNNSLVAVFPNPSDDRINIKSDEEIQKIEIFNIQGKLVKIVSVKSKEMNISVVELPSGQYSLKVGLRNGNLWTGKLIKK